jgi:hypothetical protein
MHKQVPVFAFHEQGRPIVQQVPAQKVEVAPINGLVDVQGKVVAALGRAVIAQVRRFRKITAAAFGGRCNRGHVG